MMDFLKKMFGGKKADIGQLLVRGAKVIDVRTPAEFASGHFKGSVNIPLDKIGVKASQLKKDQDYVLCCRSGMRSANAVRILRSAGFERVYNGGSWMNLKKG